MQMEGERWTKNYMSLDATSMFEQTKKFWKWVLHAMTRRQLEQYDMWDQQKWQMGLKGHKQVTKSRELLLLLLLLTLLLLLLLLVVLCSNKNIQRKEHKILIRIDSHTRHCAWNMKIHLSDKSEINGLVKPGSATNILVRSEENEIMTLTKIMQ